MAKKKAKKTVRVEKIQHQDKRTNIPTEELRDFVKEEDLKPQTLRYPRDDSLDPQLVWRGKDEQDGQDLEVPVVPIYIQEKIHPQAIVDDIRRQYKETHPEPQLDLFSDFNGIEFEELIDFYHHESNWANRMILGDSLLVMNSLAEKEGLKGQVQTIYLDPPYGIRFGSNWQASTRKRDVKDRADDATRQPEQVRAFRDTWELGIHSYLAYLRDRFVVARELLTDTGSIFVQISDENVHLVRCIMDEVFGSDNFISMIPFRKKTMPFGTNFVEQMADFILWYAKSKESSDGKPYTKYRSLKRPANVEGEFHHCWYESSDGSRHRMTKDQISSHALLPKNAKVYRLKSLEPSGPMESGMFDYEFEGRVYPPPKNGYGMPPEGMDRLKFARRLQPEGNRITGIIYADATSMAAQTVPWFDTVGADDKQYVVQTNTEVVKRCLLMTTDPGDLVLDPTCGSGTTAYVAELWGRRWITIDTSRVALALARTRLMARRFPYYLLADSPEGVKKETELTGKIPPPYETHHDIKKGFVYQRVPHVTLKSIANNPDIKEGMSREEIDAAIARHTDTELLYDKPYEDKKTVRVTGPFTMETLSPHRTISVQQRKELAEVPFEGATMKLLGAGQFGNIIIDNLKKAGVQNTIKNERLKFDSIDVHPGQWIHAVGHYTEKKDKTCRAAICIGPEHGTVGPDLIKEAAKEAVQGVGYDLLLICGFAFDPHVSEETKRYGNLTVLPVRMNPDLAMGDTLLKKTGAGNLFMVFGEPDMEIGRDDGGNVIVTIHGLDIYDPTTGEIRSNNTDDIMCWFIDTNYNGESFFVRHAYFSGEDRPYEKLKKALRAEIDEAAWSDIYSTTSRPFDPPEKGKIAVKVINHYGDEVLKVYEIK